MARKRMIDPNFWNDEKLGECSMQERLLFMGLISNADDEGYGRANPKLLKSLIFPYDDLRTSDLEKWLSHLGGLNVIVLFKDDKQTYYYLPNFLKHQTINRPTASTLPSIEDTGIEILTEYSLSTHGALTPKRKEDKRNNNEQKQVLLEHFEKIWEIYPNKKGKAKAIEYYLQWINGRKIANITRKLTDKEMYYAASKYAKECDENAIEIQFIKHGDTFFNKAILDYVEVQDGQV